MKKFIIISLSVIISTIAVYAATGFLDDNKIQNYSRPYVEALVSVGGINGYTDNTFKPQGTISRAEFLSMCVNSLGDLEQLEKDIDKNEYSDLVDQYGFNDVWNGAANDILVLSRKLGLSENFSKNSSSEEWLNPITRAEAADIIYRCLSVLKNEKIDCTNFNSDYVSDWQSVVDSGYENSVKSVYSAGIASGDSKGFFNPSKNLTREDSAILICKAANSEKREVLYNESKPALTEESTTEQESSIPSPPVGERGVKSVKNLIKTAFEPVGKVMYIYGGGWNEADTGAGKETMTLGLSQSWLDFSKKQNASYNSSAYDYKKNVSVIHDGLDCSGYVGWTIYNVMNDGKGYVTYSYKMDDMLKAAGFGSSYPRNTYTERHAGDIMASGCNDCRHVYICLGQCGDGSVLLLHSSPPGVQLTGTYTPRGDKNSEAIKLANQYMSKYYPEWHKKFPDSSRNTSYLTHYDKFEWSVLSDEEGYRNMTPSQILKDVFGE